VSTENVILSIRNDSIYFLNRIIKDTKPILNCHPERSQNRLKKRIERNQDSHLIAKQDYEKPDHNVR
jgi:hypothetical protein